MFPKPILATGQDLVFILFFSSSSKLVLTLAQAVCPVDFCCSRVPSPGKASRSWFLSAPATPFAQPRLPVCLGCLVLRISVPESSSCYMSVPLVPVASITSQERALSVVLLMCFCLLLNLVLMLVCFVPNACR
jgi:hypothetical protein